MKAALRLRHPADFARARQQGRRYRHATLWLTVASNDRPHNRYGIVTSKRLGGAVLRNRCKRRLRTALWQLHGGLCQGYDIVVSARPGAALQPFAELQRIIQQLLRRARLVGTA